MAFERFGLVYSSAGIPTAKEPWALGVDVSNKESWLEEIIEEQVRRARQGAYQEYVRKLAELNEKRLAEIEAVTEHARKIGEYYLQQAEERAQEQARAAEKAAEVEQKFRALAEQWYLETMFSSAYLDIILHPAYQKILTLGEGVVPFILRELQDMPTDWFWALRVLTDADPTTPEQAGDMEAMAQAWLEWGRQKGYI